MVPPAYSSELMKNSQTYSRNCRISNYYYETVEINVVTAGVYSLLSSSDIDTYGYIYKDDFNPFKPVTNIIAEDDDSCVNYAEQFQLNVNLLANTKYILIVTTSYPNVTGKFSIFVTGPGKLSLNRTGE